MALGTLPFPVSAGVIQRLSLQLLIRLSVSLIAPSPARLRNISGLKMSTVVVCTSSHGSNTAFDLLGSAPYSLIGTCTNILIAPHPRGNRGIGRDGDSETDPMSATKESADMEDDHGVNHPGAKAFFKAVDYAVDQTGTPSDRLTRDDFLRTAATAEASGDLRMTQRLLLLAEDQELLHGEG